MRAPAEINEFSLPVSRDCALPKLLNHLHLEPVVPEQLNGLLFCELNPLKGKILAYYLLYLLLYLLKILWLERDVIKIIVESFFNHRAYCRFCLWE